MSGKTYLRNQNFFKRNYSEALKNILPDYLYEDDLEHTPKADDPVDLIINSHLDVANNFTSILNVSAVEDSVYSGINTLSGISPFFIKQNKLTNITAQKFDDKVLSYFNKNIKDFENESLFSDYLKSTVLPAIKLNEPDTTVFSDIGDSSAIHNYLISNLSWMYFLNTSGPHYNPSSYVTDFLVSGTYTGDTFTLKDGINGLSEYLWYNGSSSYFPSELFASGSRYDLSGSQQLDNIKIWNEVVYSPLFHDNSDFRVRDKFDIYIQNSLQDTVKLEGGPFARLMRALSFFAFDMSNDSEALTTLYDIDDCPDEYLPLMAELIGWDLFGTDPARWRLQLRNAISIYKASGTKRAIQSAVNNIFPKDKFPIENRIVELWESYVPYLIYYALATESKYFKSMSTWSSEIADEMDIGHYISSGIDANIRLAVDKIILETIREFPENFPINTWITEQDSTFNYRGRTYFIPPFEEYPYYVNTELDSDMVSFITDRLVCFGVRKEFAYQVSSYITDNALSKDDEPRLNSWLIFTSGYNSPPNLDNLIRNLNDNRFDYASLWSGKSSHFKLNFSSTEFDFNKNGLDDIDSADALRYVAQTVAKFAPAHSIPLINLEISDDPDPTSFEGSCLPHLQYDKTELEAGAGANQFTSSLYFNGYKRGINPDGVSINRDSTKSSVSPLITDSSFIGTVPRNTARRRSFEKLIPMEGYYDRTGFNMPVSYSMASSLSGIPLGLIPSSMQYTPVTDHIILPKIWSQCEGLGSNNTYYEYDVSNTQNVRGLNLNFSNNTDRTVDRGQLPPIIAAMYRFMERKKYLTASFDLQEQLPELQNYLSVLQFVLSTLVDEEGEVLPGAERNFIDITTEINRVEALLNGDYYSHITSGTNANNEKYSFPTTINDYYYFKFGRDLHRLYNIYRSVFSGHRLNEDVSMQDGANILSHVYGPLLYNHDLSKFGSDRTLITSSFSNPDRLTVDSEAFTGAGSYVVSSDGDMTLGVERVSSGVLDGVELVLNNNSQVDSAFSIVRVPGSERLSFEDPFLYDRTLLLLRSGIGSTARVRYDLSKYPARYDHPNSYNFLMPDHEYTVSLSSLISNDSGASFGGRGVGIWIHTNPEQGKIWSYTKDGEWVQHDQLISRQDMLLKYSHLKSVPFELNTNIRSTNYTKDFKCIDNISITRNSGIVGLQVSAFNNFSVNFNTRNTYQILPSDYDKEFGQLHRLDQSYVIEVFMTPDGNYEEFMIVDNVQVQDLTLKRMSELYVTGVLTDPLIDARNPIVPACREDAEYRVELSKEDLLAVFSFFNDISGKNSITGYASRDKNKTETIMESEGGSRLDYRYRTDLFDPDTQQNSIIRGVIIDV